MKTESIKQIQESILKDLFKFKIDEYDLGGLIDKIKKDFIKTQINRFNKFNIKNHLLKEDIHTEEYKTIFYDKTFKFEDIKYYIKMYFKGLTKEDKIKEVIPFLMIEKVFNDKKIKYFSIYEFKKDFYKDDNKRVLDIEKLNKVIKEKINSLKEVCLSGWGLNDKYRKQERINNILEFLNYTYNINIKIEDLYNKNLKDIEEEINQNKEVKIRLFNGWYYLTLTDDKKQQDFKNRLIEQAQQIFKKD